MALLATMLSQASGRDFTVMFYNVESLNDAIDDTAKNDEEFLPGGSGGGQHRGTTGKAQCCCDCGSCRGGELPFPGWSLQVESGEVLRDLAYGTLPLSRQLRNCPQGITRPQGN